MNCDAAFVERTGSLGRHQFSLEDIVPPPTPRLLRRLRVRRLNLSSLIGRERRGNRYTGRNGRSRPRSHLKSKDVIFLITIENKIRCQQKPRFQLSLFGQECCMNTVKMRELKEDLGSKDAYNKELAVERTRDGDTA